MLGHVEKAVWCWYKTMRGPAGSSFGLSLPPIKNVRYREFNEAQVSKACQLGHFLL